VIALAAPLALYALACSSSSDGAAGGAPDGGTPGHTPDAGAADAPVESGIKIVPIMVGGDTIIQVPEDAGADRTYRLHVPPGYDGKTATPLIMNFHGYTSNASQQESFSGMSAKADTAGYIVAYPEGLNMSWNAGTCCGTSLATGVDDVGFTRRVVADISLRVHIDPKRVYVTGMSNGGFMAQRLACEAADIFAAFAPVAGVLGLPPAQCTPSRPLSMMEFHGTADPLVAYDGGGSLDNVSVADTFAGWAARNGCTDTPTETYDSGTAHCGTYSACKAGTKVTLCTLDGEGHCWPGQTYCPYGASTTDINADDAMWAFFQSFQLP
jgi:polyhydroxybutyrate depolymerase